MNKNYIIALLLLINILVIGFFYYKDTSKTNVQSSPTLLIEEDSKAEEVLSGTGDTQTIEEDLEIEELPKKTYKEVLEGDTHLYDSFHEIALEEDLNVFDEFYTSFTGLDTYEEYKKYTEKYPSLLPVIYAAKLRDKESYLKFYNFIFDKVIEENIPQYIADLQGIEGAEGLEGENLRKPFMTAIESHYEIIAKGDNSFNFDLGAGPIHIALTGDDLDIAKNNCDAGGISGTDELSKQECYSYSLHYRANNENNYCEELSGEYDKSICRAFFSSVKSK